MDKTTQLENRIRELEQKFTSLEQTNTIPDQIEKALRTRGFLNEKDIHWGFGITTFGNPEYIELPNGSENSLAMVTSVTSTGSSNVQGEVVASPTNPTGYALVVYSSNATDIFSYIVFNFKSQPLTILG